MENSDIAQRFKEFCGPEKNQKFLDSLRSTCAAKEELNYWMEKLWTEFSEKEKLPIDTNYREVCRVLSVPIGELPKSGSLWEFENEDGTKRLEFQNDDEFKQAALDGRITSDMKGRFALFNGEYRPAKEVIFEKFSVDDPVGAAAVSYAKGGAGCLGAIGALVGLVWSVILMITEGPTGIGGFIKYTIPIGFGVAIGALFGGFVLGGIIGAIIGASKTSDAREFRRRFAGEQSAAGQPATRPESE